MKKKIFRTACCLAATFGALAFSGCAGLMNALFDDESSGERSYAEDEWNPYEDPSGDDSSIHSGTDGGETSEGVQPAEPDQNKELLYTERDELGHKIAYYADGTCEDLGRETPIDFTPVAPAEKEGYQYLSTLAKGSGLCAFYRDIYNVACNFHTSDKNVVLTDGYYEIAELRFSQYGLTGNEAAGVWHTVFLEYPEFFWWGNSLLLGSRSMSLLIDPLYAEASERKSAQTAIEDMANACDGYLDGTTSTVEIALTVHDYVTGLIEYAYESDKVTPESEIWAHNIAGGAQYGKGVCESYAKTYDYLCGLFGLSCITVAGYAVQDGESFGHAWNVVEIDGGWYNVDATWNDLDAATLSREWFGTDPAVFAERHDAFSPDDGWNINYMFELPDLDEEGLTPVRAATSEEIESGKYTAETAPMYPSVEAVCDLLGEGITVDSYLYPRTAATAKNTSIEWEGATLSRITHTAGTLVIHGNYKSLFGGAFQIARLSSLQDIIFNGDVVFCDLSYDAQSVDLNGNTLTTAGTAVAITAESGVTGGNLTDETTGWTEISAVDLQRVTAQGNELCLLGGGRIADADIRSGTLRLCTMADTSIGTLRYATADVRLYIDGAAATTNITIGDVTAGTPANAETGAAAVLPEKVTIFVDYTSASDYPLITVEEKSTSATLYLVMYNKFKTPSQLGKAFIRLGENVSVSDLRIAYPWFASTRELSQSRYEKKENGDVCYK